MNIVSYDMMMRKSKELLNKGFRVVIFDECHFLKSHQSKRTNAAVPIIQVLSLTFSVLTLSDCESYCESEYVIFL